MNEMWNEFFKIFKSNKVSEDNLYNLKQLVQMAQLDK